MSAGVNAIGSSSPDAAVAPPRTRVPGLVSVVVPAYNAELSLGRCIDRVLGQTYREIELIVVNDGSTDGTAAVAQGCGERLQYIAQENRGETAARNRGFELARGEFVTFVDHDDYWEPEFVEACVGFLREHPEAAAVSVGSEHRTALRAAVTIHPAFLASPSARPETPPVLDRFFDFWFKQDHICAGSAMLRRSLIDEAGGQRTDLALSGDMEYWAYLATFGPWGFIPRVLLHVDGTQVPRGSLWKKFHVRYMRCASVESWGSRIEPRITEKDRAGFSQVRGRVATMYIFAHVFVGKDREALRMAKKYRNDLEGKMGRLWRLGLRAGWLSWKPMCVLLRARTRLQYYRADRRRA